MNNDSIPIEASASTTNPRPNTSNHDPPSDGVAAAAPTPAAIQSPAQERAKSRMKKRSEFLGDLMNKLDMAIYMELCVLYYMDCSLFRFLLRLVPQWLSLTPKPLPVPQHRPYLGGIFVPNIICFLLHIFSARPEAGESMRFYLHGGVIPDFVGQKSPSSKFHMVLLDITILVLQCVMLAVYAEKEQLRHALNPPSETSSGTTGGGQTASGETATSAQDYDAEERGVIREEMASNGDMELQELTSVGTRHRRADVDEERDEERERLLAEPLPRPEDEDGHALDIFYSGNVVLADLHVMQNLRQQWQKYGSASESAIQTVGFSAGFAAVAANRRLGARFQRGVEALGV